MKQFIAVTLTLSFLVSCTDEGPNPFSPAAVTEPRAKPAPTGPGWLKFCMTYDRGYSDESRVERCYSLLYLGSEPGGTRFEADDCGTYPGCRLAQSNETICWYYYSSHAKSDSASIAGGRTTPNCYTAETDGSLSRNEDVDPPTGWVDLAQDGTPFNCATHAPEAPEDSPMCSIRGSEVLNEPLESCSDEWSSHNGDPCSEFRCSWDARECPKRVPVEHPHRYYWRPGAGEPDDVRADREAYEAAQEDPGAIRVRMTAGCRRSPEGEPFYLWRITRFGNVQSSFMLNWEYCEKYDDEQTEGHPEHLHCTSHSADLGQFVTEVDVGYYADEHDGYRVRREDDSEACLESEVDTDGYCPPQQRTGSFGVRLRAGAGYVLTGSADQWNWYHNQRNRCR